ncbi:MAG: cobalamin-dependent protein [Actinobacteria bacterium]|nr:cobalamin-dependent protein [Actinomycetota bacterium]
MDLLSRFQKAIIDGDADAAAAIAEDITRVAEVRPDAIINSLSGAMETVGGKYETGEYFIPEMLRSAEAVEKALSLLDPYLFERRRDFSGVIVIGTVKGDIHNIGKNIIVSALRASGYEVHDLGVNVPAGKFVDRVKEVNADLLLLSAFTTSTKQALVEVLTALEEAGLRGRVKVVSGGAAHSEELARDVGVDAFASDVKSTLAVCRELLGKRGH